MNQHSDGRIQDAVRTLKSTPSFVSLSADGSNDSLFARKRAIQSKSAVKDGPTSTQTSPVLHRPDTGGTVSRSRPAKSSKKSEIGLEAFSETERDAQSLLSILYLHLQEYNLKSALEVVYSLIEPVVSFERMVVKLNASFDLNANQDHGVNGLLRVLLQDYPLARVADKRGVAVVQTLARFMAAYFSNLPLYSYPPSCPAPLPPFYFGQSVIGEATSLETLQLTYDMELLSLDRSKISKAVREQNLDDLWSANSALELMLVSGLLVEGVWLARNLGDWKSAFLLSVADEVIHSNSQTSDFGNEVSQIYPSIPDELKPETIALSRLNPTFPSQFAKQKGQEPRAVSTPKKKLSLHSQQEAVDQDFQVDVDSKLVSNVSKVLEASLVSGLDLVPLLLTRLLSRLKRLISTVQWVVPEEFYLPAPPLYCPQPPEDKQVNTCMLLPRDRIF